ncbi:MAG: hypothetical protein H0T20_00285 [Actinobacteria bacterium]|nr:hypothetical protein [Actinomycetota bacterium]
MRRAVTLGLLVLAGCGGGGDSLDASDLRDLVLQPADLPEFQRFDEGRQLLADARPGARSDPGRFGRDGGWKARYRRADRVRGGPQVVESRADLFDDDDGARRELGAARREHDDTEGATPLAGLTLGDESAAYVLVEPGIEPVVTYRIEWRDGRVTASITVNGFEGQLTRDDALELARTQDARIRERAAVGRARTGA